jgi:protein tyrosine/serine phosphatase
MNASPIPPSRKHVDRILLTMRDAQFQPIYLHCVLGRDRTSLISGLYKIYFLGVSKGAAWAEMRQSGFKTSWILHGLKAYFDKQASRPVDPRKQAR